MDIAKSLTFYLNDSRRVEKLGIGAAVILMSMILSSVLIGFLGYLILAGYCIRLLQNVRDGDDSPLPEWNQWGEDLSRGFKYAVAMFVYALPFMVLWIPSAIGAGLMNGSRGASFVGFPIFLLGMCLTFMYGIFFALATPAITIAFSRDEEIRSAFDLKAVWEWTRDHIGPVIVVTLVYIAASFVLVIGATVVGLLLCLVGLVVTIPLATLLTAVIQYHLIGQLAFDYGFPSNAGSHATPLLPAPADDSAGEPAADDAADATTVPTAEDGAEIAATADPATRYIPPASPADFAVADDAPAATEPPEVVAWSPESAAPADGDESALPPVAPPNDAAGNNPDDVVSL